MDVDADVVNSKEAKVVVWKFTLAVQDGLQLVCIPQGALIRWVAMQGRTLCLWVECDPDRKAPHEDRFFVVHGTGQPFVPGDQYKGDGSHTVTEAYVGTVLDGSFVWHVYETIIRAES